MNRRWQGRSIALAFLIAFVSLLGSTAGPFRSVSGRNSSAIEANARLWNCLVPDSATQVWYTSSYRATILECTLERGAFEAWSYQNGWRTEPIKAGEPVYVTSARDGILAIGRGLRFSTVNGDVGLYGFYDADKDRTYITRLGG